jgi:hypothetical protein
MRDQGLLLCRHGEKPVETPKQEGKLAVKDNDVRRGSDGPELSCGKGEKVRVSFALDCTPRVELHQTFATFWICISSATNGKSRISISLKKIQKITQLRLKNTCKKIKYRHK